MQLPLLELCRGKGELDIPAMSDLYVKELQIARDAALGRLKPEEGDGDYRPSQGARKRARDDEQPRLQSSQQNAADL